MTGYAQRATHEQRWNVRILDGVMVVLGGSLLATLAVWALGLRSFGSAFAGPDPEPALLAVVSGTLAIAFVLVGLYLWWDQYGATLLAFLPFLPGAVAVGVWLAYVARWPDKPVHAEALYLGAMGAVATWLLGAAVLRRIAAVDTAQSGAYLRLTELREKLEEEVAAIERQGGPGANSVALKEARAALETLRKELETGDQPAPSGLRYVLATGYGALWRRVHTIDAALIELDDVHAIEAAQYDELRLVGSDIPNRDELRRLLRVAVRELDPGAAKAYFNVAQKPLSQGRAGRLTGLVRPPAPPHRADARRILRVVSETINDYRDGRFEEIVRQRNLLITTAAATATAGCLLLGVAVAADIAEPLLIAAAAYFLVGAVVGLFARLWNQRAGNLTLPDYGLSDAQLVATLILSGMAAVLGVALVSLAPSLIASGSGQPPSVVFDVVQTPLSLVIAAVFGVAPERLLKGLREAGESALGALDASGAGGGTGAGAGAK